MSARTCAIAIRKSGPFDPTRVLRDGRPDLVLISRLQEPSVEVMTARKGEWVLLYQDSLAQLWGRASKYDDPDERLLHRRSAKREIGESHATRLGPLAGVAELQPERQPPNRLTADVCNLRPSHH